MTDANANPADLLDGSTVADLDAESLYALGCRQQVAGKDVPPPTIATLTLLEIAGSPWIEDAEKGIVGFKQVTEALFILFEPRRAARSLLLGREHFTLDAIEWGVEFGNLDIREAAAVLTVYMKYAVAGWSLIPKDNLPADKKKEPLTPSG